MVHDTLSQSLRPVYGKRYEPKHLYAWLGLLSAVRAFLKQHEPGKWPELEAASRALGEYPEALADPTELWRRLRDEADEVGWS